MSFDNYRWEYELEDRERDGRRLMELEAESQRLLQRCEELERAREHLGKVCACRCSEAWTSRGRHEPNCNAWLLDEFDCMLSKDSHQ